MEQYDAREMGRLVASVIVAAGPAPPELVAHANRVLEHLGGAALSPADFTPSTPEELAPRIPPHLRDALADLMLELAGEEPLRRRIAQAYLSLWRLPPPIRRTGRRPIVERTLRTIVGPLPRHQDVTFPEEKPTSVSMYRSQPASARRAPPPADPLRSRVARVRAEMIEVISAVERVIVGKRDVISRVLTAMTARGHVLLVDAPGVGKTQLCKALATAIGTRFGRVQLTPDLMPMDVTGAMVYDPRDQTFVFRPGPVFTNILLADEINRATPKTQSALLEVMEERTVTIDGVSHAMAEPFQVLATMNPIDHEGTFPLPAAQIDRFMIVAELGGLSPEDEVRVIDTHLAGTAFEHLSGPVIAPDAFVEWQRTVPLVHVSPDVKRAAVDYVNGLRATALPGHTLSPRATLAWVRAGQARAILAGREFVTVEDLLDIGPDVFRHRLWMSAQDVRDRLQSIGSRSARAS